MKSANSNNSRNVAMAEQSNKMGNTKINADGKGVKHIQGSDESLEVDNKEIEFVIYTYECKSKEGYI